MLATRPKSIIFLAALLVILALLGLTSALTSPLGITAPRQQPGLPAGMPGGNFQGNNNRENLPQNGNRNPQMRGGFNNFSLYRSLGLDPRLSSYVNLGFTLLGVLLALLSAWGVWKQKRWRLNLAMVVALLLLVGAVPGLFSLGGRNFNWLRAAVNILTSLAAAPILVLGSLPSVRDSFS